MHLEFRKVNLQGFLLVGWMLHDVMLNIHCYYGTKYMYSYWYSTKLRYNFFLRNIFKQKIFHRFINNVYP